MLLLFFCSRLLKSCHTINTKKWKRERGLLTEAQNMRLFLMLYNRCFVRFKNNIFFVGARNEENINRGNKKEILLFCYSWPEQSSYFNMNTPTFALNNAHMYEKALFFQVPTNENRAHNWKDFRMSNFFFLFFSNIFFFASFHIFFFLIFDPCIPNGTSFRTLWICSAFQYKSLGMNGFLRLTYL